MAAHCGHYRFDDDHGTGVETCCKCDEIWWAEDPPSETDCTKEY